MKVVTTAPWWVIVLALLAMLAAVALCASVVPVTG